MKQRNPFQFKQFTVQQTRAAMPVTTDACIFGALVDLGEAKTVLDVGTGTGLLSLMLAQRFLDAHFTGIDLDAESVKDAAENFAISPWKNRLCALEADFLQWNSEQKFDAIVCNPPFFQGQLPSSTINKRNARHTETLEHERMVAKMAQMLNPCGQVWLLIPEIHRNELIGYLEAQQLMLNALWLIKPNKCKMPHLCVLKASGKVENPNVTELIVFDEGDYTEQTKLLLGGYYLNV